VEILIREQTSLSARNRFPNVTPGRPVAGRLKAYCRRIRAAFLKMSLKMSLTRSLTLSLTVALILALILAPALPLQAQITQANEYQLKAAFLLNFAKFVDWPDKSFADAQAPFVVCVIGHDPFGSVLDDNLSGKSVRNRTVTVVRFPATGSPEAARHCQIAFISSSEKIHLHDVIAAFQGQSVLLVGDADGFVESGGAIEFVLEEDHIRFVINPDAANRADLQVSSKLLALARIVRDDPAKGKS
jgi:hypothetical protein